MCTVVVVAIVVVAIVVVAIVVVDIVLIFYFFILFFYCCCLHRTFASYSFTNVKRSSRIAVGHQQTWSLAVGEGEELYHLKRRSRLLRPRGRCWAISSLWVSL